MSCLAANCICQLFLLIVFDYVASSMGGKGVLGGEPWSGSNWPRTNQSTVQGLGTPALQHNLCNCTQRMDGPISELL